MNTIKGAAMGALGASDAARDVARRGWFITVLLTVLFMVNFADKAVIGLAAKPIMQEFHLSNTDFGLLSSSFYLLFGITGILAGIISTRATTTRIVLVMAVLWAVAMLPVLILPTVAMLYLSRIALGAAEGPASPIMVHGVQKWFPADRQALPTAVNYCGGALGIFIAGPLLSYVIAHWGWRAAFGALAAVAAVFAIAWALLGSEGPFATYASVQSGELEKLAVKDPHVSYWRLFFSPTWLGTFFTATGAYWALVAGVVWMPKLLEGELGYSPATVGAMVAIPPLISTVSMLFFPWITERALRRGASWRMARGVVTGGILVVSALAAALVPLCHGLTAVLMMSIAFGFPSGVYPLMGLTMAYIAPVKRRGVVLTTLTALITTLGGLAAPVLLGMIMDAAGGVKLGFSAFFISTAAIMLVLGLIGVVTIRPTTDARRFGLMP